MSGETVDIGPENGGTATARALLPSGLLTVAECALRTVKLEVLCADTTQNWRDNNAQGAVLERPALI